MTRDELITYHSERVREALRQTEHPVIRSFGGLPLLDLLAYDHAKAAAHAARSAK